MRRKNNSWSQLAISIAAPRQAPPRALAGAKTSSDTDPALKRHSGAPGSAVAKALGRRRRYVMQRIAELEHRHARATPHWQRFWESQLDDWRRRLVALDPGGDQAALAGRMRDRLAVLEEKLGAATDEHWRKFYKKEVEDCRAGLAEMEAGDE